MSKRRIDRWHKAAMLALTKFDIVSDNANHNGKYRSQISRFGAVVVLGGFKFAVKVFSEQNDCDVDVAKLLRAMHYIVTGEDSLSAAEIAERIIGETDVGKLSDLRDKYLDASVALKKSLNLFDLGKGEKDHAES